MLLKFVWAFLVGGCFCAAGQLLMQRFKLTPAHTMVSFVVLGAVLGGLGWYQPLVDFAGAGATTPITNFGSSLVRLDRPFDRHFRGDGRGRFNRDHLFVPGRSFLQTEVIKKRGQRLASYFLSAQFIVNAAVPPAA